MSSTTRNFFILLAIVIALGLAYSIMTRPDSRTTTEKLGDAIHELPQGLDKASEEMKDDRTPGQKLGDAVRNAGDKIKKNSNPQ